MLFGYSLVLTVLWRRAAWKCQVYFRISSNEPSTMSKVHNTIQPETTFCIIVEQCRSQLKLSPQFLTYIAYPFGPIALFCLKTALSLK
jgi:hypothetical protein